MKSKIIKIAIIALAIFTPTVATLSPTYAACSNVCDAACNVPQSVKDAAGCGGASTEPISSVITNIINTIIGMLGLVAVIFIFIGGVNYMTSAGDAGKLKKAKDTILYACIGLAICALSFAIANFAINAINGSAPITNNP